MLYIYVELYTVQKVHNFTFLLPIDFRAFYTKFAT